MIKLIEKIEGEAKLNFNFKDNKINFVDIEFMSTRNIENKSPIFKIAIKEEMESSKIGIF